MFTLPTLPEQAALIASMAPERLAPYRRAVGGSDRRAVELYLLDAELASQFHAAFRAVEVLLRQRMHEELSTTFGNEWYLKLYDHLDLRTKSPIDDALRNVGRGAPAGKVVAQLMIGAWTGLLDRGGPTQLASACVPPVKADYESLLWDPALRSAFENRGRTTGAIRRDDVSKLARSVGWARNRVNHCESAMFGFPQPGQGQGSQLRKTPARVLADLYRLADHLDSDVSQWIKGWPEPRTLIADARIQQGLAPRVGVVFLN